MVIEHDGVVVAHHPLPHPRIIDSRGKLAAMTRMKSCTRCKVIKPFSAFSPHKGPREGLQSWCRECYAEHARRAEHLDRKTALRQRSATMPSGDSSPPTEQSSNCSWPRNVPRLASDANSVCS